MSTYSKVCNSCKLTVTTLEEAVILFVSCVDCKDGIRPTCKKCKKAAVPPTRSTHAVDSEYALKEKSRNIAKRAKYYKDNVASIRDYFGGVIKCSVCGYTDECFAPFDLHHINPEDKHFGIHTKIDGSPFKNWKEELEKCVIICSNCHRKLHSKRCTDGI